MRNLQIKSCNFEALKRHTILAKIKITFLNKNFDIWLYWHQLQKSTRNPLLHVKLCNRVSNTRLSLGYFLGFIKLVSFKIYSQKRENFGQKVSQILAMEKIGLSTLLLMSCSFSITSLLLTETTKDMHWQQTRRLKANLV